MKALETVIVILGPGMGDGSINELITQDNSSRQNILPLPETLTDLKPGIYASVMPNYNLLNEVLNLPSDQVNVIVQTHPISEISRISTEMFNKDAAEDVIQVFTKGQHSYKRLIGTITGAEENISLVQTNINTLPGIEQIFNTAEEVLLIPEVTIKEDQPEVTTVTEPVRGSNENVQAVDDQPHQNENSSEESKVDETSIINGEVGIAIDPNNELNAVTTKPSPVVEVSPTVEPSPSIPPQEQSLDEEHFTDALQSQLDHAEKMVEVQQTASSDKEDPPLVSDPEKVKVEESKLNNMDLDFDQALNNSLAKADANLQVDVDDNGKPKEKAWGIPDTYPNVDQTVTFNEKQLFKPAEDVNSEKRLVDFGGTPTRFSFLHNRLYGKIDAAMGNPERFNFNDFEQAVYEHGEDRVAGNEHHNFQYVNGARWANMINAGPTNVPLIVPIKDPDYGSAKYFGPETVSLLRNRMKTGVKLGVFLPHTGIYFIIVSPGDDQFIDALAIINNQRIQTLRASSGILMGNSNFYINRQVLKLFIDSIVHCSLTAWNREILSQLIDERDTGIMAQVLGASIYPDGYEYVQVCGLEKTDKTVCTYQTQKLVDLRRMIFVDNSRLSEEQKIQAAAALSERSKNEIERYQQANYIGYKKPYEIVPGIQFVYRAQSISKSIDAGEKWIKEIEGVVDSIITFNNDEETRNLMIEERMGLSRIREYGHWVEEILIDDQPMTDRDKIDKLLSTLSRNKDVVRKVSETISEFQRLSSIAMVAVPRCKCPECLGTNERDLDISTHLIPQDAVSRLFTLVRQLRL